MKQPNVIDELILAMQMDVDDKILLDKINSLENINMPDSGGMTLLTAACIYVRLEIAKKLIEFNADVNVQYPKISKYTALHAAVENKRIDAVIMLIPICKISGVIYR